jgi:hypothetical protein
MTGTHSVKEDFPWMIAVIDHPARKDSAAYVHSRALMKKLVATSDDWVLSGDDYQDHHGGSVWVKDQQGWLCLQLPLGIEWSAQFCADPAKVDKLRQYAQRVVGGFPATLPGYEAFGYHDGPELLATPVTDAAGVAAWTDSIFNASLPLPAGAHTGVLPHGAGYHHYPKPIVVPVSPRGSGDGRVRLLAAHVASRYIRRLAPGEGPAADQADSGGAAGLGAGAAGAAGRQSDVLPADDPLARKAFAAQQ